MTPQIAIFMIFFLLLWLFSIRINNKKGNFTKKEKELYIKKFKTIRLITMIAIILFIVCIISWFILEHQTNLKFAERKTSIRFMIIWWCFLMISTLYHYYVVVKATWKY
jgi:hypothetical protein